MHQILIQFTALRRMLIKPPCWVLRQPARPLQGRCYKPGHLRQHLWDYRMPWVGTTVLQAACQSWVVLQGWCQRTGSPGRLTDLAAGASWGLRSRQNAECAINYDKKGCENHHFLTKMRFLVRFGLVLSIENDACFPIFVTN